MPFKSSFFLGKSDFQRQKNKFVFVQNFILKKTSEISNDIYQSIPENSRKQLENFNQNQTTILIQEKINLIKEQSQGFPQKQIKEIQKMIVNNIHQNTLRSIDSQ